jgi:hypothetical protein
MRAAAAVRWLLALGLGALLLAGRFEWGEAGGRYAREAFASSLYFFCLVVPASGFLTLALTGRPRLARAVWVATFLVGCLPYHLLGLSRFRQQVVVTPWTAAALPRDAAAAPGERALLLALLVVVTAVAAAAVRATGVRGRLRRATPIAGALAVIVVETLAHTSLRSPYTYGPLLEVPGRAYHAYLLPGARAAVNADVGLFTSLDEHFNGLPKPIAPMLIRRSFVHYLGSHFSYFFNPYYVYLVVNALLWLAAAAAGYDYVLRVSGSRDLALLFAGLVLTGNGFIYYVAQPMSYLAGYATVIVALCLYERLLVEPKGAPDLAVLYGILLGLCAATYDLLPLYPMLLLYGRFRGVPVKWTAAAIALAAAVPSGFLVVQYGVLNVSSDPANSRFLGDSVRGLAALASGSAASLYEAAARALVVYAQDLVYAFAVVGAALAAAGILFAADRRTRAWFALLLLPSLLSTVFFSLGGMQWGRVPFAALPRLAYAAYPAVYLGAALAIDAARRALARTRASAAAPYLPWLALAAFFAYHNSDVAGFVAPQYHFYWPTPIGCDPYAAPASCADPSSASSAAAHFGTVTAAP